MKSGFALFDTLISLKLPRSASHLSPKDESAKQFSQNDNGKKGELLFQELPHSLSSRHSPFPDSSPEIYISFFKIETGQPRHLSSCPASSTCSMHLTLGKKITFFVVQT